jgi:glutathione S-transferase
MTAKIRLHSTAKSGHGHRVELLLRALGLDYERVDAPPSVRQTDAFAALNPLRQIPVLEDGDLVLADSNAILVYLAKRYGGGAWLPEDAIGAAQVQRWLSIAAGEVKYGPSNARAAAQFGVVVDEPLAHETARKLLAYMDQHLAQREYLAADRPTLADLACYAYVAHAPEGGVTLAPYPAVRAWLKRIEALPAFLPMPASPIPA